MILFSGLTANLTGPPTGLEPRPLAVLPCPPLFSLSLLCSPSDTTLSRAGDCTRWDGLRPRPPAICAMLPMMALVWASIRACASSLPPGWSDIFTLRNLSGPLTGVAVETWLEGGTGAGGARGNTWGPRWGCAGFLDEKLLAFAAAGG